MKKTDLVTVLFGACVLVSLYVISLRNYLLFHSIAEVFSIVIAFSIFVIAWNSRRVLENGYLLFLGIAYLFIGALDLLHTLAYTGMGVFPGTGTNLATQIWISGRYPTGGFYPAKTSMKKLPDEATLVRQFTCSP